MSVSAAGLDEIISGSREAREVKRALCVKMALSSLPVSQICELLNVSASFVSKWRGIYKAQGATGLGLSYVGSQSFLTPEQRSEVIAWIQGQAGEGQADEGQAGEGQARVQPADVRDYLEERYGIIYRSQQSYYELMHAAGMSYHKSEKVNPKRDEEQVQERRKEIKKNWRSIRKR